MQYRMLGKTDMNLSLMSMGGASFSSLYGEFDEDQSIQLIKACLKRGINYIDTGPWYGQGTSETTIGKALEEICRDSYFIGTKVGRYEKDPRNMFDFSAERTLASVDESLQRLGLDYVDLIQVHDGEFGNFDQIIHETLPALQKVVEQKKARYIGIASYDLDFMKSVVVESEVPISSILSYAKSTLIDNRLQEYIPFFKSRGVGVINAAATAMGLLTNQGPPQWHPASEHLKRICRKASSMCVISKVELADLATWFSLQQPDVDTTVCGFRSIDHVTNTCRLMKMGLSADEETALNDIQIRYFRHAMHWDHVEVENYKAELAKPPQ